MKDIITVEIKTIYLSEYYTNKWGNKAKDILGWSVVALIQDEEYLGDYFTEGAVELAVYSKSALYRKNAKDPNITEATEIEVLSPIYCDREGKKIESLIVKPNDLLRLSTKSVQPKKNRHGQDMIMSCGRKFYEVKIPLIMGVVEKRELAYSF